MADMIVPGMAAVESAARIYRNREEPFSSGVLAGSNGVGKTVGGSAAEKIRASFREYMEDALQKETAVFPEGKDVVMSCPPLYRTNYQVDMNKPREEMTLDEYKQYVCNSVSSLPVSDSKKMCGSGVLIFKEEALESMKNNPAYEQEVIHMLGESFSTQLSDYEPHVEYQVIGKSKKECYGASIPLKNYGWMMGAQGALASPLLSAAGFSGLGLASSGFSTLGLTSSGLPGSGLSGLGLTSSGLLGANLSGLGLLSSGLLSSGLSGYGLLSGGLSSAGLPTLGASRASMVNAYKNTLKNRNSDGKTRLSERR